MVKKSPSKSWLVRFLLGGNHHRHDLTRFSLANIIGGAQMAEFCREAQLMMSIRPHMNVVKVYGVVQEIRNLYDYHRLHSLDALIFKICFCSALVMEYIGRGSLEDWLEDSEPEALTGDLLFKIVRGIAAGMAHLAKSKIIHRYEAKSTHTHTLSPPFVT